MNRIANVKEGYTVIPRKSIRDAINCLGKMLVHASVLKACFLWSKIKCRKPLYSSVLLTLFLFNHLFICFTL